MATKKQRRRREKEHRHEYEYVYIDEEGKEVEVEQPPSARKEKERRPAASANGRRLHGDHAAADVDDAADDLSLLSATNGPAPAASQPRLKVRKSLTGLGSMPP